MTSQHKALDPTSPGVGELVERLKTLIDDSDADVGKFVSWGKATIGDIRKTIELLSLRAALTQPSVPAETFWVVERFENDKSAGYWDGGHSRMFVPKIDDAIQFRRRQDAQWVIVGWHWKDVQITEHMMLPAAPHVPARWKLAPIDPTEEMVTAGNLAREGQRGPYAETVATYRAMIEVVREPHKPGHANR